MKAHVFSMATIHEHGTIWYDFLRLRKSFLVDELNWKIPHNEDVEMDQYDTPNAWYSVVEENGRVVAGARCQSSTAVFGDYSCMLADAGKGMLPGIPSHVFDPSICQDDIWECDRLVIADNLGGMRRRVQAIGLAVDGLVRTILANDGTEMLSFSPPPLRQIFGFIGIDAYRIGGPVICQDDNKEYEVYRALAVRDEAKLRKWGIDPVTCSVPSGGHEFV